MLWLLHYQPEAATDAGGGVPAQTKPVIILVNWNWLHMGFHSSLGAEGPAFAEQISRCKCAATAAPKQDSYKKMAGTRTWVFSYLFRKGEEARIHMAKLQSLCTNIYIVGAESGQGQALLSSPISVPLQKAVTNSHYKSCFTFANGDILLTPRQQEEESVILDSFYHTRKTS